MMASLPPGTPAPLSQPRDTQTSTAGLISRILSRMWVTTLALDSASIWSSLVMTTIIRGTSLASRRLWIHLRSVLLTGLLAEMVRITPSAPVRASSARVVRCATKSPVPGVSTSSSRCRASQGRSTPTYRLPWGSSLPSRARNRCQDCSFRG